VQPKKPALLIVYTQVAILTVLCAFFAVWGGESSAFSALLGGLAALLPTIVMLWVMFLPRGQTPGQMVRAMYRGEVLKLVLTAVLFVLFINWFSITGLSFFVSFVVTLLAYWVVLIITMRPLE
jgi:ATP synthase protein I